MPAEQPPHQGENEQEYPIVAEVMWRLRYPPEIREKRRQKLPWYDKMPVENLESIDEDDLTDLQKVLLEQKQQIETGAERIDCPTAFTDGRLSFISATPRKYFEIPGGLSLRPEPEVGKTVEKATPARKTATTGSRLARLFRTRRHENK